MSRPRLRPHLRLSVAGSMAIACAMIVAGSTLAQPSGRNVIGGTGWDRSRFEPVEPNVGDVSPLSAGSRLVPADLRVPLGFDRVYRMPGADRGTHGYGAAEEKFVRFSGGLAAVFPRSEYIQTEVGSFATIPAGTTFYIGGMNNAYFNAAPRSASRSLYSPLAVNNAADLQVPTLVMAQPADGKSAERADLRVREVAAQPTPPRPAPKLRPDRSSPAQSVFTDPAYRNKRVRELLLAAVQAGG